MSYGTFEVAGPGGAPCIVLIHGVTVNRMVWRRHLRLLSERYRVLALDLPGHGSLAGEPFLLRASADRLRTAILDEAGGRALVVGDSLGGYCALAFAASNPHQVSGLVLASCTLPIRGPISVLARAGALLMPPLLPAPGSQGLVNRIAEARTRGSTPPEVAASVLESGVRLGALPEVFRELAGRDFRAMLRNFPGPVLILNGQKDLPFRLFERAYVAAAQNAHLHVLEGARHTASSDVPEQFVAAILAFASSIGW